MDAARPAAVATTDEPGQHVGAGSGEFFRVDRVLFETAYVSGARASEVCGMYVEDLDLRPDDEHARVHGKGGTVRTVLLDDRGYVALLRLYLARAGYTSGPLFRARINGRGGPLSYDAAHNRWKKYRAAAGTGIGIHQLRHAHATELKVSTAASPSRSCAAASATPLPRPLRPTPCSPTRSPTPKSASPAAGARPRAGEPGMAPGSLGCVCVTSAVGVRGRWLARTVLERGGQAVADEVIFTGQSGKIWRYWDNKPLGTPGGFGGVYAAEGPDGTPMAVKVVKKQRPSGALDDRLLRREIDIGKRVADCGSEMLLPVIDAADAGDALLLVMPLADGALAAASVPIGEAEVVPVLVDIATGLQDLHSIGIIHRDLKPANVLRHAGRWKLADFGIARDQEIGTQDPTFVGWGSFPYMAPELWELKSPTIKTDLYALGCLGYELLAGAPPYTGDQAALRAGHLTQAPPEAPCGDVVLKSLIGRLIAKRPEDRPQDARAVLDRLRRVLVARGPVQESIARGLGAHAAEQARAAAEQSAAQAAEDARRQQIAQAKADLREIVNDALSDLRAVEPDATSEERGTTRSNFVATPSFSLTAGGVRLRIDLWEGMTTSQPVQGDTMILAGCVMITNPSYDAELNSANLVYERVGDRLAWQIYKFRSGLVPPDRYAYGPYGRTHGLRHGEFFDPRERSFMLRPVMHVWSKTVTTLTAETILELFQEAVDLRPPDPRSGIW